MAWQNPKTDWAVNPKNPVPEDFNRIEGNIDFLKQDIETKKGLIVDAINDMNQPAQVTDTHAQLASKIRDISKDATAAVGDVEKGKTFYAGGQKGTGTLELTGNATAADVLSGKTFYNTNLKSKVTGTMSNRGAVIITPGTTNQPIAEGYHNGSGYVKAVSFVKDVEGSGNYSGTTVDYNYGTKPWYVLGQKATITFSLPITTSKPSMLCAFTALALLAGSWWADIWLEIDDIQVGYTRSYSSYPNLVSLSGASAVNIGAHTVSVRIYNDASYDYHLWGPALRALSVSV